MKASEKTVILLKVFEEKNKAVNIIRDRVQAITLWIVGFQFAADAFILQNGISIDNTKKLLLGIFATAIIFYLRFGYFADLERGFNGQRLTLVNVEKELSLYGWVYPDEWKNSGSKNGKGKFFKTNYLLLEFTLLIFIFVVNYPVLSQFISNFILFK